MNSLDEFDSNLFTNNLDFLLKRTVDNLLTNIDLIEFDINLVKEVINDLVLECQQLYTTFAFEFHFLTGKESAWINQLTGNTQIQEQHLVLINMYLELVPEFCDQFPKLVILNSCSGDILQCWYYLKQNIPNKQQQSMDLDVHLDRPVLDRDSWYLISSTWYKAWLKYVYTTDTVSNRQSFPVPIDNRSLLQGMCIKSHLCQMFHYHLIPEEKWQYLISWYGIATKSIPIRRIAVRMSLISTQPIIEIYPIRVKCSILNTGSWEIIRASRMETVYELLERVKLALKIVCNRNNSISIYKVTLNDIELLTDLDQQLENAKFLDGQEVFVQLRNEHRVF
ncbi:hypothetical protein LOD99_1644 [Oopsacas minuta]|uniref:DUSP domain-containing protein n=1 Tax=Oopsacas minuta TaxID=111878 RepID=A0AAV7K520_9METZ|nr:hypothetical protein LOD99_1644 [Oopsacas minuta]